MRTNLDSIFWDIRIPEHRHMPNEVLASMTAQLIFEGGYHSLEDYLIDPYLLDRDRQDFINKLYDFGIDPGELIDFS